MAPRSAGLAASHMSAARSRAACGRDGASRNLSDALRATASRGTGVSIALGAMINPAAGALASVACIAAMSSWWAVVRSGWLPFRRKQASRNVLQANISDLSQRACEVYDEVRRALLQSGLFGTADADSVSELIGHLRPVRFPSGHVVFAQGDPGSCLYLIASGKVKIAYQHTDGRRLVTNIVGDSDVFGEVTPFDDGTREFTATTVTEVCAVAIERDQLLAWMAEFPEISHQMMRLMARHVEVTNSMVDYVFADPRYRVARRLLSLSKRFGRREGDIVRVAHDLTSDEISQFAGVAPETADATLRDFRDRGWIRLDDKRLDIVDAQELAAVPVRQVGGRGENG